PILTDNNHPHTHTHTHTLSPSQRSILSAQFSLLSAHPLSAHPLSAHFSALTLSVLSAQCSLLPPSSSHICVK
ncbi:MAG: hypothetical protein PHF53_11520, partial [Bacteroidales bacterium]|nr:hypothetical protein [Bacteroidales bacterium]